MMPPLTPTASGPGTSTRLALVVIGSPVSVLDQVAAAMCDASVDERVLVLPDGCPADAVTVRPPIDGSLRLLALPTGDARVRDRGIEACTADWILLARYDVAIPAALIAWLRENLDDPSVCLLADGGNAAHDDDPFARLMVFSRQVWSSLGGFDAVLAGSGAEVADFLVRLHIQRNRVGRMPGALPASPFGQGDDRAPLDDAAHRRSAVLHRAGRLYSSMRVALGQVDFSEPTLERRQQLLGWAIAQVEAPSQQVPHYSPTLSLRFDRNGGLERANGSLYRIRKEISVTLEAVDDPVLGVHGPKSPAHWRARAAQPMISCLMVTRGRPAYVRQAIDGYLRQTWQSRELVIVTDVPTEPLDAMIAALGRDDIRLIRSTDPSFRLGDLRNLSVAQARGTHLCQWDDDDVYHPQRLERQCAAMLAAEADACMLTRWTMWWPARQWLALSGRRDWEGSLLCARDAMPAYPSMVRGEDTPAIDALIASHRVVRIDRPDLYLYVVHGANTYDEPHFEEMFRFATESYKGASCQRQLDALRDVLPVADYPRGAP